MEFDQVLGTLKALKNCQRDPSILLIHCGGNDLGAVRVGVQAAVKCIANSRDEKAIARALYSGSFKQHFHELVNETIESEAQKLCSSVDKSCLQHKEAKDIIDIDWDCYGYKLLIHSARLGNCSLRPP
jgi:hypothetical protein